MARYAPYSGIHAAAGGFAHDHSAASTNWVGAAGGSGDWNTAGDWATGSVPGATGTANFALGGATYTVTGDATIAAITLAADTTTFDGAITQNGSSAGTFLSGTDGAYVTLDPNSVFMGNGGLGFATGTVLDVQGSLTLLNGGGFGDQVIVEGLSGALVTGSALTVNGLYVQSGGSYTGDVTLNDGGNITIDSSALFGANSVSLLGSGTLYESLAVGAGSGQSDVSAAVSVAAGQTLTLASDPSVHFLMGGVISGSGGVVINGGDVELAAVNSFQGGLSVQNATLTIDGQGAAGGNAIILDGATLISQADTTGAIGFTATVVATGSADTVNALVGNLLVFAGAAQAVSVAGGTGADTIVGGQGALSVTGGSEGDLVFGGAGGLTYDGGAGFSRIVGNAGGMTIRGGAGNVAVFGGTGTLNFVGGSGASFVVGGAGAVVAAAGSGGDTIFGGTSGMDRLYTGNGPATLVGGAGAQLFAYGTSSSVLVDVGGGVLDASASTGNDTLFGGRTGTSDTITSGAATSTIVLGGGTAEVLTTGVADVFAGGGLLNLGYVSGVDGGVTKVVGFDVSKDVISLTGYGNGTAAQVLASETVSGGTTILRIPNGGDQIVLFGTTGLTASNFVAIA